MIVCYVCFFLNYWTGLLKEEDGQDLEAGARVLQENALAVHSSKNEGNDQNP